MDALRNRTIVCQNPTKITSEGVWNGKNPLTATVPLFMTQLTLITLTSKAFEVLLRPLGQTTIVAQIVVSTLPSQKSSIRAFNASPHSAKHILLQHVEHTRWKFHTFTIMPSSCSQISQPGGLVLGPSVLGLAPKVATELFPERGRIIIETVATFGLTLFLFSMGVKMDSSLMFRPERAALIIGASLFIFTLIIPVFAVFILIKYVTFDPSFQKSLPLLVGTQSLVAFPAIACVLAELKIFNTEIGRLAMAVAMFYDLLALCSCAVGFAYFETRDQGLTKTLSAVMSVLGMISGAVIIVRLVLLRFVVSEKTAASDNSSTPNGAYSLFYGCFYNA